MKYRWLQDKTPTPAELGTRLGYKIKSIASGDIIIGYEPGTDAAGNSLQVPIVRRGIEIEFEGVPPPSVLLQLARDFRPLRRGAHTKFTPSNPTQGVEHRLAHVEEFLSQLYPPQP